MCGVGNVFLEEPFVIDNEPAPMKRVFLGVTPEGYFVVQEFYTRTNTLKTDPFVLMERSDVIVPVSVYDTPGESWRIAGRYVAYHPNGQKQIVMSYVNGKPNGSVTLWYANGQIWIKGQLRDWQEVGVWRNWDEDGNLLHEIVDAQNTDD